MNESKKGDEAARNRQPLPPNNLNTRLRTQHLLTPAIARLTLHVLCRLISSIL